MKTLEQTEKTSEVSNGSVTLNSVIEQSKNAHPEKSLSLDELETALGVSRHELLEKIRESKFSKNLVVGRKGNKSRLDFNFKKSALVVPHKTSEPKIVGTNGDSSNLILRCQIGDKECHLPVRFSLLAAA